MGAENSIVDSADDWCVAVGTAHLTAPSSSPPINITAVTHDALILMQPSVYALLPWLMPSLQLDIIGISICKS